VADVDKQYKNINKFFVTDGVADVNGQQVPLAPEISELPCLIDGKTYVFRSNTILTYLKQSGEVNATANIL
jgi:hypothetical protein